jgi:hypothetical protein
MARGRSRIAAPVAAEPQRAHIDEDVAVGGSALQRKVERSQDALLLRIAVRRARSARHSAARG